MVEEFVGVAVDILGLAPFRYHVPIFNPGSNSNQVSVLRLINVSDRDTGIVISGVDDFNQPSPLGDVRLNLLASAATTMTAQNLEQGDARFSGLLGDGTGKWRLEVSSDQPIQVMSLLRSPTGNITNLSR